MAHCHGDDAHFDSEQSAGLGIQEVDSSADASSAPVLITGISNDASDVEENRGLLGGQSASAPQASWRNLASLSLSALSGDTIWHQARADRNR